MAIELESHDLLVKRALTQRVVGGAITVASLISVAHGISLAAVLPGAWFMFSGFLGLMIGPMVLASAGRDPNTRSGREGRLRFDPEDESRVIGTAVQREATPLEHYESRERLNRLQAAADCDLSPIQRRLFEMHHLQHQSIREIAHAINKSVDAVKSDLYRARRTLLAR